MTAAVGSPYDRFYFAEFLSPTLVAIKAASRRELNKHFFVKKGISRLKKHLSPTNKDTNVREIENVHQNIQTKQDQLRNTHLNLQIVLTYMTSIFLNDKNFWATVQ